MTTKPTDKKTPDTEELKDDDLDKVQGGWSWGETNSGSITKDGQKKPGGEGFTATDDLWKVKDEGPSGLSGTRQDDKET